MEDLSLLFPFHFLFFFLLPLFYLEAETDGSSPRLLEGEMLQEKKERNVQNEGFRIPPDGRSLTFLTTRETETREQNDVLQPEG